MKILLTGCAGFIGSSLLEKLLLSNEVIGIDNFDDYYSKKIKEANIKEYFDYNSFTFYELDINNKEKLNDIFGKYDIDLVIHLAAQAGVRYSLINPHKYLNTNLTGTLNILEGMRNNNCKRIIFASSSSVYGNNKKIPFSESDIVNKPISLYAATKVAGELLLYNYWHLWGINSLSLRFFTVYGPRQRPDMAFYKFITKILLNKTIDVYSYGESSRDYTYIDDITEAIIKFIDIDFDYDIVNLGNNYTVKLIDVIQIIEDLLGKKSKINFLKNQPGDVNITLADISKAKSLIGYSPKVSLEIGLKKQIEFILNKLNKL